MKNFTTLASFLAIFLCPVSTIAQPVAYITQGFLTAPTTWVSDTVYVVQTTVTVMPGSSLTICPGTKILFDTTATGLLTGLRVARGGKIYADGSLAPIVLSSARPNPAPGDWIGVGLFGYSPGWCEYTIWGSQSHCIDFVVTLDTLDHFGEGSPNDTSGVFRYVRIEYAGGSQPGTPPSGRALWAGGVGSGTRLDHIEVYKSGYIGFELMGGTVNSKYLIANQCANSDFRLSEGYQGNLQFLYVLRNPSLSSSTATNALNFVILGDSFFVKPILSNMTIAGPVGGAIASGYNRLVRLYFDVQVGLFNSVLCGKYPTGLYYEGSVSPEGYLLGDSVEIKNTLLAGPTTALRAGPFVPSMLLNNWFSTPSFQNHIATDPFFAGLKDPFNLTAPNPQPSPGAWVWNKASFTTSQRLADPFFEKVNFIGAFGSTDWTHPWASWHGWNPGTVSCLSGTDSLGQTPISWQVFPQPASGQVIVSGKFSSGFISKKPVVWVADLTGRVLDLPAKSELLTDGLRIELDASSLPNGLYLISLQGDGYSSAKKMLMQH